MKPATKSNRLYATDPHINLSAAITPTELHSLMETRELTNGFANRFMMIWAERTKLVSCPRSTPPEEVNNFAGRLIEVLKFCQSAEWANKDRLQVALSPEAKVRYDKLYRTELNDSSAGEKITALIERRAPMVLRLAMLFALCDLTTVVQTVHINAALAWVRYSVDSIKFVFASAMDEVAVAETNEHADKIVKFLMDNESATRSDLTLKCFQCRASKTRIDQAIDELLSANPPKIEIETMPRQKGHPGSGTKIYRLSAKSAKSAKSVYPCGFAGDFDTVQSLQTLGKPQSLETDEQQVESQTLQTLQTLQVEKVTQVVDLKHSSQTLQTLQTNPENSDSGEEF